MRFNKEKMNEINERINKEVKCSDNQFVIANSYDGITVLRNHWYICDLEELNDTIKALIIMRKIIESETGLVID